MEPEVHHLTADVANPSDAAGHSCVDAGAKAAEFIFAW